MFENIFEESGPHRFNVTGVEKRHEMEIALIFGPGD